MLLRQEAPLEAQEVSLKPQDLPAKWQEAGAKLGGRGSANPQGLSRAASPAQRELRPPLPLRALLQTHFQGNQ